MRNEKKDRLKKIFKNWIKNTDGKKKQTRKRRQYTGTYCLCVCVQKRSRDETRYLFFVRQRFPTRDGRRTSRRTRRKRIHVDGYETQYRVSRPRTYFGRVRGAFDFTHTGCHRRKTLYRFRRSLWPTFASASRRGGSQIVTWRLDPFIGCCTAKWDQITITPAPSQCRTTSRRLRGPDRTASSVYCDAAV